MAKIYDLWFTLISFDLIIIIVTIISVTFHANICPACYCSIHNDVIANLNGIS